MTSVMTSSNHIISGQLSRKRLETGGRLLLGAYRKVGILGIPNQLIGGVTDDVM